MKRWGLTLLMLFTIGIMAAGIVGCGANYPTKTDEQNQQSEQKLLYDNDTIQPDDGTATPVT